jgi:hypothetical protein
MSLSPAVIDALVEAGVTVEQLAAAVKAEMAEAEARKARQVPWARLRTLAFQRDGEICRYCAATEGPFEIDHVIPRIKGGEDILENVVVACLSCNRAKRDRDGDEWASLNERRLRDRERKRRARAGKRGQSTDVHEQAGRGADNSDPPPNDIYSNPPPDSPKISNEISPQISEKPNGQGLKPDHVLEAWNDMAGRVGLPKAKMTPERRRKLAVRIRQHAIEDFTEAISAIERSPFLRGENDRAWRPNFDFLLQPTSFTKLIEGTYDGTS